LTIFYERVFVFAYASTNEWLRSKDEQTKHPKPMNITWNDFNFSSKTDLHNEAINQFPIRKKCCSRVIFSTYSYGYKYVEHIIYQMVIYRKFNIPYDFFFPIAFLPILLLILLRVYSLSHSYSILYVYTSSDVGKKHKYAS
jgi:hypothetical protein